MSRVAVWKYQVGEVKREQKEEFAKKSEKATWWDYGGRPSSEDLSESLWHNAFWWNPVISWKNQLMFDVWCFLLWMMWLRRPFGCFSWIRFPQLRRAPKIPPWISLQIKILVKFPKRRWFFRERCPRSIKFISSNGINFTTPSLPNASWGLVFWVVGF